MAKEQAKATPVEESGLDMALGGIGKIWGTISNVGSGVIGLYNETKAVDVAGQITADRLNQQAALDSEKQTNYTKIVVIVVGGLLALTVVKSLLSKG